MAWQQKSRSNSEGRMKMGLVKWEAGKEAKSKESMHISAFRCDAKHFDGNEELDRRYNQWQYGESFRNGLVAGNFSRLVSSGG